MMDDRLVIIRCEMRPSNATGFLPDSAETAEIPIGQLGQQDGVDGRVLIRMPRLEIDVDQLSRDAMRECEAVGAGGFDDRIAPGPVGIIDLILVGRVGDPFGKADRIDDGLALRD